MKGPVVVTGVGTLNAAFAGGADALAAWLAEPRSVLAPADDFPAPVARLPGGALETFLDETQLRRLSRVSQLAVAAARLALDDAELVPGHDLGLIVGTEFGDLRSTMEFADGYLSAGPAGLSALLFPNTVMNTMAAATSIAIAARGLSLTLNEATIAGELAVAQAAAAVAAGRVPAALAGGVDQVDAFLAGALDDLGTPQVCRGEGATFLVLETLETARGRGARVLGRIAGVSCAALPARPHGIGRSRTARGAGLGALAGASVFAASVGRVYTATNGDAARDAWEDRLLDAALPHRPPRTALRLLLGDHAGIGPLSVAAAALAAGDGDPRGSRRAADALVHGVARGGAHVAIVVAGAKAAA